MGKVIYSKINKERKRQYQIITNITQDASGKKELIKKALSPEGVSHIKHMVDYSNIYDFEDVRAASCDIIDDTAVMEYIDGKNMCDILLEYIDNENLSEAIDCLKDYKALIYKLGKDTEEFSITDEFKAVFGSVDLEGVPAGRKINIDCILENIIKSNDKYVLIDYEWYFDFLVPFDFVIYRALFDLYIQYHEKAKALGEFKDICSVLGISERDIVCYSSMNESFNDYVYDNSVGYNSIKKRYSINKFRLFDMINETKITTCLYYDDGSGFDEERSFIEDIDVSKYYNGKDIELEYDFLNIEGIKRLRFDPMMEKGFIKLHMLTADDDINILDCPIETDPDTISYGDNTYLFLNDDPQLVFEWNSDFDRIRISFSVTPISDSDADMIKRHLEHIKLKKKELEEEIIIKQSEIERYKNYSERLKYNNNELTKYINSIMESLGDNE